MRRSNGWLGATIVWAVTAALVLWGGAAWAGTAELATSAVRLSGVWQWFFAATLCIGVAGVAVFGVLLGLAWMPARAVGAVAAALVDPARWRLFKVASTTPVLAFVLCGLTGNGQGVVAADLMALGGLAAALPCAVLLASCAWLMSPAVARSREIPAIRARTQRLLRNAASASRSGWAAEK